MSSAEYLQQANQLMSVLQFQNAEKLYQKVLETEPKSIDARVGLGRLALIRHQTDQGVQLLEEALRLQPNHAEALALKGVSRMQAEDWKSAVELLNQARNADPNLQMTYYNLAHSYRKLGNLQEAETAVKKAIALNDKDFQSHAELSYIYGQSKKVKEGIEEMLKAIEINPYFLKGYLVLAALYRTAAKHDLAIELYRQALGKVPAALMVYEELSDTHVAKGDYKAAYMDAVTLVTKRNDFRDYLRLGSYALALKDPSRAEKAFQNAQALKYDPVAGGEFLKKILASDNNLLNEADTLRKAVEAR